MCECALAVKSDNGFMIHGTPSCIPYWGPEVVDNNCGGTARGCSQNFQRRSLLREYSCAGKARECSRILSRSLIRDDCC
ncbi:unnamed protein product [Pylaiella littoralis]